ncbi:putative zinc finger protein [Trypanosoma vivax]|nr:putative zinc finger protein [Trypanosoma vivax]
MNLSGKEEWPDAAVSPQMETEWQAGHDEAEVTASSQVPHVVENGEEQHDNEPETVAHLRRNFGVLSRVLEREVFRRGLISCTIPEMIEQFFIMSSPMYGIVKADMDQRVFHNQLFELLLTNLEQSYGAEHARFLASMIEQTVDEFYVFQALFSQHALVALVQQAEEYMNPQLRASSSSNYGEGVRGVQQQPSSYVDAAGPMRPSYTEFVKERRGVQQPHKQINEPKLARGNTPYVESSSPAQANSQDDDAVPANATGWSNSQRKHVDHEREVPVPQHHYHHHHHHHHHHHNLQVHNRGSLNQYAHQQRAQVPGVSHHQVVVGSASVSLLQQPKQQQMQDAPQGESFPRVPLSPAPSMRMMDRISQGVQGPDDVHVRAPWRGPLSSPGSQTGGAGVSQPSYNVTNSSPSPPVSHQGHGQQQHGVGSTNSPSSVRPFTQHRHNISQHVPPGSMGKPTSLQPTAAPTGQHNPTQTPPANTNMIHSSSTPPPQNSQRIVLPHHHHHLHHHHHHHHHQQQQQQQQHDLPMQQPMTPSVVSPPQSMHLSVKQEPATSPEATPVAHNVEIAHPQLRPHFHHQISFHHMKMHQQAPLRPNAPSSVGGDAVPHSTFVPTHHHSIHQAHIRAMGAQQHRHQAQTTTAPMSVDAINDDVSWSTRLTNAPSSSVQELRCFLRDRSVPEDLINTVVKAGFTKNELLELSREVFDERLGRDVAGRQHLHFLWSVLHPEEKGPYDKDMPEMNDLRNFINNNSIHNNMGAEAEEDNGVSRRGRQGKSALHVPQPRTSQVKQQPAKPSEYKAVVWLSGVNSLEIPSVLEKVAKYGKVVQHGMSVDNNLFFCKLKDVKNDIHRLYKIGNAVVEEFYRVTPRPVDDGEPPLSIGRDEEGEENEARKQRSKTASQPQASSQQNQHQDLSQSNRESFVDEQEQGEELEAEDGRAPRKGTRHVRARGRGGHHVYARGHPEGFPGGLCRFFNKGHCKHGGNCQFVHPKGPSRSQ